MRLEMIELAIEVDVEPIHAGGLVDQPLRDAERLRRARRRAVAATACTSLVERLGREDAVDQAQLAARALRRAAD